MSYDFSMMIDTGNGDVCVESSENYTYNISPMLYDTNDGWERIMKNNVSGALAGELMTGIISRLEADPEKYRAMNPENGWGDYDSGLKWCKHLRDLFARHPKCTVNPH